MSNLGGNGASMFWEDNVGFIQSNQSKLVFAASLHHRLQKRVPKSILVAHPDEYRLGSTQKEGGMASFFTSWFMRTGQSEEDGAMGIFLDVQGRCSIWRVSWTAKVFG